MERLAVPLTHFSVLCLLPIRLVAGNPSPKFSAANGQFLFFRRDIYQRMGGHASVQREILEDVAIGRATKRAGARMLLVDGSDRILTHMYHNAREVWQGFSKNLFGFFNHNLAIGMLAIGLVTAWYILPPIWVMGSIVTGKYTWWGFGLPLLQYALAVAARRLQAGRFGFPKWDGLLHPLSAILFVAILVNSIRWQLTGRGALWKGRRYHLMR